MKILKIDEEIYKVFGDTLEVNDTLPAEVFTVCFAKMQGFYLKKHPKLEVKEKLYGIHEKKINKLLKSWEHFERSMGVIFSGDKGMGKSIAARMLCEKSNAIGLPVILVEENIPGIAQFIDSIHQECIILFDEFEKNFRIIDGDDEDEPNTTSQDNLLSLFDGTGSGIKRMYIITCNDVYQLSDFLVNRPGRFHYHIRWEYPTDDDIREYLMDNIKPEYHKEIEGILSFTNVHRLNYDCLRAISFEINMGTSFAEAIPDLNIINKDEKMYEFEVTMKDGSKFFNRYRLDILNEDINLNMADPISKFEFRLCINDPKIKFRNGLINIGLKNARVTGTYSGNRDDETSIFAKEDFGAVLHNIKSITAKQVVDKDYYNYNNLEKLLG